MIAVGYLILGFILAGLGGEAFVRGSVSLSGLMRIPPAIIGVTVAAFATSCPELSVAIHAAAAGKPQIALGDALGSNVVNICLVLGSALCFGPLAASRRATRRDWVITLLAPLLIGLFAWDGQVSRTDGLILLVLFGIWLAQVITEARKERTASVGPTDIKGLTISVMYCLAGAGLLMSAGIAIVTGAKHVGTIFDIPPLIVGVTLVAFGTSMPELATTIIARMKGHSDMGLATILGSTVFNVFVIAATAAVIHPITVRFSNLAPVLTVCTVTTLLARPTRANIIPRYRGFLLVLIYVVYIVVTLTREL